MANWYETNYVFVGDKEDVNALYDKLKEIEAAADPNENDDYDIHWLGRVVEALGGSVKKIPCRGEWYNLEKRGGRVYFDTSTANGTCNGVMDLICEYFESLKYFYRFDGDGPSTNDKNGKYFEHYKIDMETPEGECYEQYFITEKEALKFLSEKTERELTSKEDVVDLRHEWEDLEDCYAYVWLIEYEYCSREDELGARFFSDIFWQNQFTPERQEQELMSSWPDVILETVGDNKVEVIKLIKKYKGIGLMDAKHLVETVPSLISSKVSYHEARDMKQNFEALGAKLKFMNSDD